MYSTIACKLTDAACYAADDLIDRLVAVIRKVEEGMAPGKQCFPMASTKSMGFCNEYELKYILGYVIFLCDAQSELKMSFWLLIWFMSGFLILLLNLWSCSELEGPQKLDLNKIKEAWRKASTVAVVAHVVHTYSMTGMVNYMVRLQS
jgi:hypothetical protein